MIKLVLILKVIWKEKLNSGIEYKKYFYYKKRNWLNKDLRKLVNVGCKLRYIVS